MTLSVDLFLAYEDPKDIAYELRPLEASPTWTLKICLPGQNFTLFCTREQLADLSSLIHLTLKEKEASNVVQLNP